MANRKNHFQYSYTARDGSRVSKHFASPEAATAWFARIGATEVTFRHELKWDGRCWQRVEAAA